MNKPSDLTPKPVSKTESWINRFRAATTMKPSYSTAWRDAEGVYLTNLEGDRYMTLLTSAHTLGYKHPEMITAAQAQIAETGLGRIRGVHPTLVKFAEKLKSIAPPRLSLGRISLCNSGSEATSFAMQLVRAYTGKLIILAHLGGHYGTAGAHALTADIAKHRRFHPPLMPGIIHVPYPHCYRCSYGQQYPGCDFLCIEHIRYTLATVARPKETAGFFIESIGSQNVAVPPKEYFPILKEICEEHEILFIDDEALLGFGKTGRIWGIDHWEVEPDIMLMAKSAGNGIPLAIILGTKEIMDEEDHMQVIYPGSFTGNLVACACASAHIDILQRDKLVEKAAELGKYIRERLREFSETHEQIGDVRGKGLIIGIDVVKDSISKQPDPEKAARVVNEAFKRKLIIKTAGTYNNIHRRLPSLILTQEEAEQAITTIIESFVEAENH